MFKNLHMKLVAILVLLVVSVMSVVGTFLINSVTSFYINEFSNQVALVFTTDFIVSLDKTSKSNTPVESIHEVLSAYSSAIGIDSYRNFYILDKKNGEYIAGSNEELGKAITKTPNIISAISGSVGDKTSNIASYMDVAIPISDDYIVYIKDTKQEIHDLTWILFTIILQAMMFGLIIAVFLSFLLSKTMTIPIENLTKSAKLVASGKFDNKLTIHSTDEIGVLTETFNNMAEIMEQNLIEIAKERDKLNALFLHMTDGVIAFNNSGDIIHMNPSAERILEIPYEDELTFEKVFKDNTVTQDKISREHGFVQCEIERGNRNFVVILAPFGTHKSDNGIMAVIRDITEQKRLDDMRREFVANVSHELRTPLTNIKGYAETIIDNEGDIDADTKVKFLGVILNEADRMTRIVKDLLTLSKLDYGKMEIKLEKIDISKVIDNVYRAMDLDATQKGHILTLDIKNKLGYILADSDRIEQVLVNVVSNSIKYTTGVGDIKIIAKKENDKILITVSDNGMGIPAEDIPRLFERFYRVDKARSRERGGTGLGLAIAKEIINIHCGDITVSSEWSKGTDILITLPSFED